MIGDFEYLYMIRKNNDEALKEMLERYNRLVWSRAHRHFNIYNPDGISVQDLYQEGRMALYESFFSYEEERKVGLAYYIDLCITSKIKTELRRCRGYSYKMLDTSYSLDMSISEDHSLNLGDLSACTRTEYNPQKMSHYQDALKIAGGVLSQLSELEIEICTLRYQGFSYSETALLTNVSAKKVDNVIQKVRKLFLDRRILEID